MGVQAAASPEYSMCSTADCELARDRYRYLAWHATIFLVAFLVLFSRRPDAVLNAQFWAEDGKYWYADAYQYGWRCLLMPLDGYLNTLSRLVGLFALLFPFAIAPLVMNLCAIAMEILPVHLFLSSRFSGIALRTRLMGSLLYLALPNSFETHAIMTNLQWRLALAGCLILLGRPEGRRPWRIFDAFVLAGVTVAGPLGILLVPIAGVLRWLRRDAQDNLHLIALIPGAMLQSLFIGFSNTRPSPPNGATLARFIGILGGQVFASLTVGMKTMLLLYLTGDRHFLFWAEVFAALVGFAIMAYSLRYGPLELKLFLLFAALVFASALWNPLIDPMNRNPQWELLQFPGLGNRYYYFPMLSFLSCLIWMVGDPGPTRRIPRYLGLVILAVLPVGIYRDWRYPHFKEFHFREFAAEFERAAPGKEISIPLNPTGWQMQLVKH
jgi:hypothetical protein